MQILQVSFFLNSYHILLLSLDFEGKMMVGTCSQGMEGDTNRASKPRSRSETVEVP